MFLEVVRHHSVSAGECIVALPTHVDFARALQVDPPEGLIRKWQTSDATGDQWFPRQNCRKCKASWGASYGLSGAQGNGCHLWHWLILLWGCWWCGGERVMDSLMGFPPKEREPITSYDLQMGSDREELTHQLCRPLHQQGQQAKLQDTKIMSSSWRPSCSRQAAYLF